MTVKTFDALELNGGKVQMTNTNSAPVHVQVAQEVEKREKNGFIPGQGKDRAEAFGAVGFEFSAQITRENVFALIELATLEIDKIKNLFDWANTEDGIVSRAIIYLSTHDKWNAVNLSRYLKIRKETLDDLLIKLEARKAISVGADGIVKIEVNPKSEIVLTEASKFNSSTMTALDKDQKALYEARGMSQSNDEERALKCETILKLLNKNRSAKLTDKSKEVKDLRSFSILVTKVPHSNYGVIYSTPDHGGIKLGHFMFVAYERREDEKTKDTYWGMVKNPYSNIDWSKHQGRLKIIGWGPDRIPFKEARKFGVFSTTNLTQILPKIHQTLKERRVNRATKIEPLELYYFKSSDCDYTDKDGVRYVHTPNSTHSILYEGGLRRGLAGTKVVPHKYKHRDGKTGDTKEITKEIILTEWIPDDPNQAFTAWQERATKHVVELCKSRT